MGWTETEPGRWRCPRCTLVVRCAQAPRNVYHNCPGAENAAGIPCPHRGDQVREAACQLCGGGTKFVPIYACALYGECALARTKSGRTGEVRQCLDCRDRPTP